MGIGAELRRQSGTPFLAGGTDIAAGNLVKLSGPWQVVNVTSTADEPVGVARASASAKGAVDVRDSFAGDIVRAVAAATIAVGTQVGFASNGATTGASGNVQVTMFGPIKASASEAAVWSAGQSVESANPGNEFAFRVNPRQLSGLK